VIPLLSSLCNKPALSFASGDITSFQLISDTAKTNATGIQSIILNANVVALMLTFRSDDFPINTNFTLKVSAPAFPILDANL